MRNNYNKKIFYSLLIKINFIKKLFICIICFISLYSCTPFITLSDADIKVIKNGTIEYNSSYMFLLPKVYDFSYTLTYQSILEVVSHKLSNLGLVLVKDANKAKYAVIVRINNYPIIDLKSSELASCNFNNHQNLYSCNKVKPEFLNIPHHFSLDIFLIKPNSTYVKVMEGYTQEIRSENISSLTEEKGIIDFIKCSLTALFDKRTIHNSNYLEYYYKCWP